MQIFISHTHADVGIVDAFRDFLEDIFDDKIKLRYSSSTRPGEGIPPGAAWLPWIQAQVHSSQLTIVFLTAESVNKPWVLWETGAVTGVSIAGARLSAVDPDAPPTVIPLLVGIQAEQIPSPLHSLQALYGDNRSIERLVLGINASGSFLSEKQLKRLFDASIDKYLGKLGVLLRERPLPLDEPSVIEWLARLEELRVQKRSAEVGHYHKAMVLAFTSEANREGALLDIRLHRRIGEMYYESRRGELAAKEFAKAIELTHGKDLYLLHKLGLAQLQSKQLEGAQETIDRIAALDPEAAKTNPEIAGLVGRHYRERWERDGIRGDLERSRDAYNHALEASERLGNRSYYMADNVGQLSLLLGEQEVARRAFQKSREFIVGGKETSLWAYASLASACFAIGEEAEGIVALGRLRAQGPDSSVLDSIEKGLARIRDGLGVPAQAFERWKAALQGQEPKG